MIVILGASGYVGQAFIGYLRAKGIPNLPISRRELDYTRFGELRRVLTEQKPSFLINAAGFTGKPNVDACETAKAETLLGNAMLPQTVAHACEVAGVPWGHVSSGCIFNGAKVVEGGFTRIISDLTSDEAAKLLSHAPEKISGFKEDDEPNFSFRRPPCSFYSGTKALAEEAILTAPQCYVWRLRIPFDEVDNSRNYLSKLQRYPKVYNNVNSLSQRADYARACFELWERRAPYGTYNVVNPGYITAREAVDMIRQIVKPAREFEFWSGDAEFYQKAALTPRSNCILDVTKLLATGIKMRPVHEAVEDCLRHWRTA